MQITEITLKNFKSIGDESQVIELSPITLLFGPNSAGKSTVLMSLMYIHHILKTGDADPKQLKGLPDRNIGGFKSLIHMNDLTRDMEISVSFVSEFFETVSYEHSDLLGPECEALFRNVADKLDHVKVKFVIGYDDEVEAVLVKAIEVIPIEKCFIKSEEWLARIEVAGVQSLQVGDASESTPGDTYPLKGFARLNVFHPILLNDAELGKIQAAILKHASRDDVGKLCFDTYEDICEDNEDLEVCDGMPSLYMDSEGLNETTEGFLAKIDTRYGALPKLGEPIAWSIDLDGSPPLGDDWALRAGPLQKEAVRQVISNCTVLPLDQLLRGLEKILYIGPLRSIPDRQFSADEKIGQGDWVAGLGALQYLARAGSGIDSSFLDEVNYWLRDKLNTGYSVEVQEFMQLPKDGPLALALALGDDDVLLDSETIKEYLADLDTTVQVCLKDESMGLTLHFHDLGVGISQVLPVIVASLGPGGFVAVEQPELHIHPALQVNLGDLFIHAVTRTKGEKDFTSVPKWILLADAVGRDADEDEKETLYEHYIRSLGKAIKHSVWLRSGNVESLVPDGDASATSAWEARKVFGMIPRVEKQFLIETHSEHLILRLLKRIRQTTDGELEDERFALLPDQLGVLYVDPPEEGSLGGAAIKRLELDEDGEFTTQWPRGFFVERREELM
ncbi:AAA family ATPase [Alcanivorax sp. 1008]|uniref:AAA family ATPase n=1 Tax=Alcanivorax sp. 1008 TaxID=2816853 RepID=UPI001D7C63E6|nr:AAA family ATPase [Alcanivorax sp. 1008]MCC1497999.1 AAA family ATPase [Alcanivorax sp. 1008]